jgi:hexosaminidase
MLWLAVGLALMPQPAKVEPRAGRLPIDSSFRIGTSGCADPRVAAAADRMTLRLLRQTGLPQMGGADVKLAVECAARGNDYPLLGEDESYTLEVAPEGATLRAPAGVGALRGLETFAQAVAVGAEGFEVPAMRIEDRPRFPWRGLMIDVSRHWMPVDAIERNLDAMAAVKLNVLHWHLSDDQGFRVESKRWPRLHELGSDGLYYTQEQIRRIVEYARERGIRVIPEFDMPGHTQSWFAGYPELASTPRQYGIGRVWGIYEPVMDPTREGTYEFLEAFLAEMTALFPDPYFHIGGDEVMPKEWRENPRIQIFAAQNALSVPNGLQAFFNRRVAAMLAKSGKTMVGWDEVLDPDLPASAVIQSWRGNEALAGAAKRGHRAILSSGYYLDHLRPASFHYAVDPLGGPAAELASSDAERILGGEACMWAEHVNAETLDSRIWPRMAAVAERFWSPRETVDVDSMYERLAVVSRFLEWTGVRHRANYEPMLDRLTAGRPAAPLRVLAEASEAQGHGGRLNVTSLTPLNRFVDAIPPESESVRAMELAAARLVADPSRAEDAELLRHRFTQWAANHARFEAVAKGNVFLEELLPLSSDLSALGRLGLELLAAIEAGQTLAPELPRVEESKAEVALAAFRPVQVLLGAVK